ncbi:hypothetical protein HMI54_004310 [Coelomomyces lativittatus]|nr:hypothetical protein HMI55_002101 [Coelomomyces lativittatus]KAJ1507311.1 hypothetical protein HMI54_004310 [Coelomomyces lativittatus]KAJ1514093.1 hypothetical protein HMI56_001160 [Coelomomyces lativittatus]
MLRRLFSTAPSSNAGVQSIRPIRPPKPYRIITKDPPPPQPVIIKPKNMSKLAPPIASFEDGTTVHLNVKPEAVYTSMDDLPPLSHRFLPTRSLTESEIEEVQHLRQSDPKTWTVRKLAKKFNVNGVRISQVAPCPRERVAFLKKKEEIRLSLLSVGSLLALERRKKARDLW